MKLQRNGDSWKYTAGEHCIFIDRITKVVELNPVFKKNQCGFKISVVNMHKDSLEHPLEVTFPVTDPELDSEDFSVIDIAKQFINQYALGTFGMVRFPSDNYDNFAYRVGQVLRFLGESSHPYVGKDIRIPINSEAGRFWYVKTGMGFYTATRRHNDNLYVTTITCDLNTEFNAEKPFNSKRTVTFKSRTAEPLTFDHIQLLFK